MNDIELNRFVRPSFSAISSYNCKLAKYLLVFLLNVLDGLFHELRDMLNPKHFGWLGSHQSHCQCKNSCPTTHIQHIFGSGEVFLHIFQGIGMHMRGWYHYTKSNRTWAIVVVGRLGNKMFSVDWQQSIINNVCFDNTFFPQMIN